MRHRRSLEFSFSGLKTAVAQHVARHGVPSSEQARADLCASFQHAVVTSLVTKSLEACRRERVPRLVLGGGVAANRGLRQRAREACERAGVELWVPPVASCTDNAAMIAYAGARMVEARGSAREQNIEARGPHERAIQGVESDPLALSVFSTSPPLRSSLRAKDTGSAAKT
jgi:N6-L-threonylcarbamoyladenine synthase